MVWVLWDILIPLVSSFGLGILLGWLLWRWRRQMSESVGSRASALVDVEMPNEPVEIGHMESADSNALSELEAANITLIGERDRACDSLESLRSEADALKARCDELEAQTTEHVGAAAAHSDVSNNGLLTEPLKLVTETTESEELHQLKENLEVLKCSLDTEKKAKRSLELELLNRQNQYEKLEAELQTESMSGTDEPLQPEATAWELKYNESLQQSESLQAELEKSRRELGELKAVHLATVSTSVPANAVVDGEVDQHTNDSENNNEAAKHDTSVTEVQLVESNERADRDDRGTVKQFVGEDLSADYLVAAQPPVKRDNAASGEGGMSQKANVSGYVPSGWSVPSNIPDKKQRDNLTDIKGIGPVLEKMLHESGIYYFRQVALLDKSGVDELQLQIPQFPGRIRRDNWVKQAKKLHASKYGSAAEVSLV